MESNANKDSKNVDGKDDDDDSKKRPFSKSSNTSTSKTAASESPKSEKDINNNNNNYNNSTQKSPVKTDGKMKAAANLHNFRNNGDDDDNSSDDSFIRSIRPKTTNNDTSSVNHGDESSMIKSRNVNNRDESNGQAPGAYEIEGRAVGSVPEWARRITPPETSSEHRTSQGSFFSTTNHTDTRSVRFTDDVNYDDTTRSGGRNNHRRSLGDWLSSLRLGSSTNLEDSELITATSVSDAVPIVYPDEIRTSTEIELEQKQQKRRHAIIWSASMALVIVVAFVVGYFVTNKQGKSNSPAPNFCEEKEGSNDPYVQCQCHENGMTDMSFTTNNSTCWYNELKVIFNYSDSNSSCDATNLALWWVAKGMSLKYEDMSDPMLWGKKPETGEPCIRFEEYYNCLPDSYDTCSPNKKNNTKNDEDKTVSVEDSEEDEKYIFDREQYFREAQALAIMYYSLNGKDWNNQGGWLNHTEAFCDWYGVRCQANNEILFSLNLKKNNLNGSFPKEIRWLKNLRNLNLESNAISGSLPHNFWPKMKNIRFVKLANNAIQGTIPDAVDLYDLGIQKLNKTCQNKDDDDYNKTKKFIEEIGGNMTDICDDPNMAISSFYFSNEKEKLAGFLGDDNISNATLHEIHYFDISNNSFTGELPFGLSYNSNLRYVDMSNNKLSKIRWENEKNRTSENFFPRLDVLRIGSNQFNGTIPERFINIVVDLEEFDASLNDFSGTIPTVIGKLSELRILNLKGNDLTGTIPSELKQLRQLEHLYLNENSLTGNITDEFCDEVGYNMLYFEVDCGNISCECCTNCNNAVRVTHVPGHM